MVGAKFGHTCLWDFYGGLLLQLQIIEEQSIIEVKMSWSWKKGLLFNITAEHVVTETFQIPRGHIVSKDYWSEHASVELCLPELLVGRVVEVIGVRFRLQPVLTWCSDRERDKATGPTKPLQTFPTNCPIS